MLTHVVIFRTRDVQKAPMILEGLKTLEAIGGFKYFHVGEPVPSERVNVDDFFDCALVVSFEDGEAGLKRYSEHPIHVNFIEKYLKPAKGKAVVYDIG